jgi:hypothetical protein
MELSPLAIALQGIGYGSHLTAVQGLAAVEEAAPARVNLVITRAWLEQMRARRLALAPKRIAREKTKRETEEELEEFERVQTAQAERAALIAAEVAAEREAQALMARLASERGAAETARRHRRRRQQQIIAALAH